MSDMTIHTTKCVATQQVEKWFTSWNTFLSIRISIIGVRSERPQFNTVPQTKKQNIINVLEAQLNSCKAY